MLMIHPCHQFSNFTDFVNKGIGKSIEPKFWELVEEHLDEFLSVWGIRWVYMLIGHKPR
jgi:hypothetical protein